MKNLQTNSQMITKTDFKPGTMIYPLPAVLVGCGDTPENYNLITIAWTGTLCTDPPVCYISVRPERHSYALIRKSGDFTINLTTSVMAKAVDWCGVRSGRDHDKWKECGLTPGPSHQISSPVVMESPVNIECRVKEILELGCHHAFVSEVVNIQVSSHLIDPATGKFNLVDANLLAYVHGTYRFIGKKAGSFGFSVKKARS